MVIGDWWCPTSIHSIPECSHLPLFSPSSFSPFSSSLCCLLVWCYWCILKLLSCPYCLLNAQLLIRWCCSSSAWSSTGTSKSQACAKHGFTRMHRVFMPAVGSSFTSWRSSSCASRPKTTKEFAPLWTTNLAWGTWTPSWKVSWPAACHRPICMKSVFSGQLLVASVIIPCFWRKVSAWHFFLCFSLKGRLSSRSSPETEPYWTKRTKSLLRRLQRQPLTKSNSSWRRTFRLWNKEWSHLRKKLWRSPRTKNIWKIAKRPLAKCNLRCWFEKHCRINWFVVKTIV